MADIFISYSQHDRAWVKELASALEVEGFSVWWDPELLPGTRYRDEIRDELEHAKAVIVVWSRASVESDWVRDEAEEGRKHRKLIPALKEAVEVPHGFRQIQTSDLSQWQQLRDDPQFEMFVRGIGRVIGDPARPVAPPAARAPATGLPRDWRTFALPLCVLAVVIGGVAVVTWHDGLSPVVLSVQQAPTLAPRPTVAPNSTMAGPRRCGVCAPARLATTARPIASCVRRCPAGRTRTSLWPASSSR